MEQKKAFVRLGEKTLLEHTAGTLATIFSEVIIVADTLAPFQYLPYHTLQDDLPGLGPIGGIRTALKTVSKMGVFVAACDMPFLNGNVIRAMQPFSEQHDLVMPSLLGKRHPLHAIYTKACLPSIEIGIERGDLAPHLLLEQVKSYIFTEEAFSKMDPCFRSLVNINTREDLENARLTLIEMAK